MFDIDIFDDLIFDTSTYGVRRDIQHLDLGSLVQLFEIDLNSIGIDEHYYFHNGVNGLGDDVVFDGITYTRFPIEAEGFEMNGTGQQPRPTLRVANITGLIGALSRENQDLVKVKFIRRRTFPKYLDAVNFTGGVNPTADPNAQLPQEIWFIDRKTSENQIFVEWELASASDMTGVLLPRRQVIQNVCLWQYRSAECGYTGGAVADKNDQATTDINQDACGKRLQSCRLRFGSNAELPFSSFPSVNLIR
jgi:lambda family phage minor tail protein L